MNRDKMLMLAALLMACAGFVMLSRPVHASGHDWPVHASGHDWPVRTGDALLRSPGLRLASR